VTQSSPRTTLAEGAITQTDQLAIELVAPHGHPQMIMVRWPDHPTMISPRRYADTANVIMRLFATAHIELARISVRRL
jgi:hypothetical protein